MERVPSFYSETKAGKFRFPMFAAIAVHDWFPEKPLAGVRLPVSQLDLDLRGKLQHARGMEPGFPAESYAD